jgi:hypothetical protein
MKTFLRILNIVACVCAILSAVLGGPVIVVDADDETEKK